MFLTRPAALPTEGHRRHHPTEPSLQVHLLCGEPHPSSGETQARAHDQGPSGTSEPGRSAWVWWPHGTQRMSPWGSRQGLMRWGGGHVRVPCELPHDALALLLRRAHRRDQDLDRNLDQDLDGPRFSCPGAQTP